MSGRTVLYVGCYTHESPVAIRVFDASDRSGRLEARSEVTGVEHASFLAAHPSGRVLYAVSETGAFDGGDGGGVLAFAIDADGSLGLLDRAPSHGAAPCHLSVDHDGRHLHVANYGAGSVAAYRLMPDGRLGELVALRRHRGQGLTARQEGPHAHCVTPSPIDGSVYAADLGIDQVVRYAHGDRGFEGRESLHLDAGSGPRHLAFHPEEPVAFVLCELSSTIEVLEIDEATGRLRRLGATSTLPEGCEVDSIAAELRVHPDGRRIYASNRGHDSIARFGYTSPDQPLIPLGHVGSGGRTPRSFALHPAGRALLVANQDSDNIVGFAVEADTGALRPLDDEYAAVAPVCLTYVEVPS